MLKKILILCALGVWLLLLALVWLLWQDYTYTRQTVESVRLADAAVVFAAKNDQEGRLNACLAARMSAAAELYQAGKVKKLIVSGNIGSNHRYTTHNLAAMAEKMGVPREFVAWEDQSEDVFEHLVFSRRFIDKDRSVVIVGSGFQLLQAKWLANRQWSQETQVYAAPFCAPFPNYAIDLARELKLMVKNHLQERY